MFIHLIPACSWCQFPEEETGRKAHRWHLVSENRSKMSPPDFMSSSSVLKSVGGSMRSTRNLLLTAATPSTGSEGKCHLQTIFGIFKCVPDFFSLKKNMRCKIKKIKIIKVLFDRWHQHVHSSARVAQGFKTLERLSPAAITEEH